MKSAFELVKLVDLMMFYSSHLFFLFSFNMMIDYLLVKAGICEGYTMVCDMKGQTWGHMAQVNIFVMRKFMYYIQVIMQVYSNGN